MNRQQNPAVISRQAKLEREENAFRDTKLEDIEFVAGVRRMIVPAVCSLSGIVVMFCGKNLLEQLFVHKERDHSADGTVERVLIVIALVACITALLWQLLRPKIGVSGREFYYRKVWHDAHEIEELHITRSGRVQIILQRKKLCSYAWDEENTELLIAWARKCGVQVRDDRGGWVQR